MALMILAALSPRRRRLLLNGLGLVILLAGYTSAVLIWRAQDRADQAAVVTESDPLDALDSRSDTRQIEMMYGKSGLMAEGVLEWLKSLRHGKPLARTLIVLSSAAAIGCFVGASRIRSD